MEIPNVRQVEGLEESVVHFKQVFNALESEIRKIIVGQGETVQRSLGAIFAGGHVLLEGVPGLGKTLLVRSISKVFGLPYKRIQFTPDLMPSDVTGTQVLAEDESGRRSFQFKPGPLFSNLVLADEINRATPKTQAALLEAMEERQVTVLGETYKLDSPFFVIATQNPVELEGTYPLPEAQLDRFLVKLHIESPSPEELKAVLTRTTGKDIPSPETVFSPETVQEEVEALKMLVREVYVPEPLYDVLVRIVSALTPGSEFATKNVNQYIRFGPGPRGAQSVILSAKVFALLDSRINLAFEDIRRALIPALRHRLILNFHAEADGISADDILSEIKNAK